MTTPIDFSEFTDDVDDTQLLTAISNTAEQLQDAIKKADKIAGDLAAAQHTIKTLSERTLPELMGRAKMESFKTTTGLIVEIEEKVRASMPKETKDKALSWLRENSYGALIKTDVKVEFSAGKEEEALKLYSEVQKLNTPSSTSVASNVHPSTFDAWARKAMEDGVVLPADLFKVFRQRFASVGE